MGRASKCRDRSSDSFRNIRCDPHSGGNHPFTLTLPIGDPCPDFFYRCITLHAYCECVLWIASHELKDKRYCVPMSSQSTLAHGHGIATISGSTVLDVWFPSPGLGALAAKPAQSLLDAVSTDDLRNVRREVVSREIDITQPPQDAVDVYLRLHLLSHRFVKPHGLSSMEYLVCSLMLSGLLQVHAQLKALKKSVRSCGYVMAM